MHVWTDQLNRYSAAARYCAWKLSHSLMAAILKSRFARVAAGAMATLFGVLTTIAGGRALFGGEAARMAVGAAVPFVVWFKFAAGLA